jgi:oxygen-independent coproporphyrinogen-3 oxidase
MAFPAVTEDFLRRYDVEAPRYTSYPTVPVWSDRFGPEQYARALAAAGERISLYVHLPFCRAMCAFCGCNLAVKRDEQQVEDYLAAVEAEMALVSARLGERRKLVQIHWGGGTPTTLDETQIERIWRALERHFDVESGAEVAVEVAPSVTTAGQLRLLRRLGFNRLSMGVQDLDAGVLQAIHREQNVDQITGLLELGRELGFKGINFDLIYGLPLQTPQSWAETLERILAMGPDRAAVYSFAYVPQVRHHQRLLPLAAMAQGRDKLELFKMAYQAFESAGYQSIGMDHFANADDELSVAQRAGTLRRNFQGYTVSSVADVVALGATGISDVAGSYAQNIRSLPEYQSTVRSGALATARGIQIDETDLQRREIIQQLMCNFRVDLGAQAQRSFRAELEQLEGLERDGLVHLQGTAVDVTPLGKIFIRNVAMVFDAHPPSVKGHARTV